ncbi:MAG: YihY/virulence factor BrkB family protein [Thiobacillaceae bacterium]|jgi:membrane protein|nr:YihY/virulence factor BrkB family protein [Thiobacillaceae bacterium]
MSDLGTRIRRLLWAADLRALPAARRWSLQAARMLHAVLRDMAEGQLNLHAMSLVYTTLLSLVPLLALTFSVLKGFGVHNQVEPALLALLEPLGEQGKEITREVIGFVDNIRVGVLGAVGLALLIYTVTTLLQKIEDAFNHVWHVRRGRPLAQRFSQYLSVVTVGPVLVFAALGITAALVNTEVARTVAGIEPFGTLIEVAGRVLPYLLVIFSFAFVYVLMPNTRVSWRSALAGGLVGGVLWQTLGWGFATFVAASGKYTAVYAGFAVVILAMIWLYLNWLIVLIGTTVAFYHQHPEQLAMSRQQTALSNRVREKLALLVMALIGRQFYTEEPAWTLQGLAERLDMPINLLEPLVDSMKARGFITETGDDPPRLVPACAPETHSVKELIDAVRAVNEGEGLAVDRLPHEPMVEQIVAGLDAAVEAGSMGLTLRDLAGQPAHRDDTRPE